MTAIADIVSERGRRRMRRAVGPPTFVEPMKATLVEEAFDDPDWIFERKFDGVRCIVVRDGRSVRLYSRNGNACHRSFPELCDEVAAAGSSRLIADGEIVALDTRGTTSFPLLQRRLHVQDPRRALMVGVEVELFLFDLLRLGDADLRQLPLVDRVSLLRYAVDFDAHLHFSEHVAEHGVAAQKEACRSGWEGVIAKRADSRYVSRRSREWLKLKCIQEEEFQIVGYTEPGGTRRGFGALLLAAHAADGNLRYVGKVGTGFSDEFLVGFVARLQVEQIATPAVSEPPQARSDERIHWVQPRHVARVGYADWTPDGRLRHPRFRGLVRRSSGPRTAAVAGAGR